MLNSLTICNIILIDRLHIDFEAGLCVLSGETGAGKSILMDSLGLALGGRGGRDMIRHGADQASVTADFFLPNSHEIRAFLENQGLSYQDGQVILRRSLMADGRSKAYINDQPVSIGLLRSVGDRLVEIHGQHDERGLLNPAGHRRILDDYGDYPALKKKVQDRYDTLVRRQTELAAEKERLNQARADEDYVRHNLAELEQLAPEVGEEDELAERRHLMMQGEQMIDGLKEILAALLDKGGVEPQLRAVIRRIGRMAGQDQGLLDPVVGSLDRAAIETGEGIAALEAMLHKLDYDPQEQEMTEERLFALRAAARKHGCRVDDLPGLRDDFMTKCQALDHGDGEVYRLEQAVEKAENQFHQAVSQLSKARKKALTQLDDLVNEELPPLKMEKARFQTALVPLAPAEWGPEGGERIEFQISTNPGAPFGGLIRVASGGELSRFILALKVVLSRQTTVPTLIFDEIDRGVGGAVADAVGERLFRLAQDAQILVITHSPQVAARAAWHWLIEKTESTPDGAVVTRIRPLDPESRREEIARMLAGATVTDAARVAAASLMQT